MAVIVERRHCEDLTIDYTYLWVSGAVTKAFVAVTVCPRIVEL
jgi:hypothetical protein